MAVLTFSDCSGPEYFHEIPSPRRIEGSEVTPQVQLAKETSGSWTIRVPASPDADTVGLAFYRESLRCRPFEGVFGKDRLNRLHKDEVGGAGTIGGPRGERIHVQPSSSHPDR